MKDCRKRQVERRGDTTTHRCVHKQADTYRQPVDDSVCNACPLRVFIKDKKPAGLPVIDTSPYPSCELRTRRGPDYKCNVTNLPVTPEQCLGCVKEAKEAAASFPEKVKNYVSAMRRWVAAGKPERTDEQIEKLFDEHCSKCNMFDKERQVCNSCGCPASKDQPAIRNKLRMATEKCPLGQFPSEV